MRVVVNAPAKVNLSLDIVGERDDGYHLVRTVMQSVDLCDTVTVSNEAKEAGITVICDEDIPEIEENIAVSAAKAFFEAAEIETPDLLIKIKKRIPIAAGLGGASADAAAVLTALDQIYETPLGDEEMLDLATAIGADVPFCLCGGTALAEGIGGLLNPLPDIPDCYFVLVKPCDKASTAEMFRLYDKKGSIKQVDTDNMVDAVCTGDLAEIGHSMVNVFEELYGADMYTGIRKTMRECGALGGTLTGSGPTYIGVFENKGDAADCVVELKKDYNNVFLTQPISCGCEIEE